MGVTYSQGSSYIQRLATLRQRGQKINQTLLALQTDQPTTAKVYAPFLQRKWGGLIIEKQFCKFNLNIKQLLHQHSDIIFSSPELKAQVSFSDHLSSVLCLSVCLSVCKLFTFSSSSPEPLDQFQPNLAQSILG